MVKTSARERERHPHRQVIVGVQFSRPPIHYELDFSYENPVSKGAAG